MVLGLNTLRAILIGVLLCLTINICETNAQDDDANASQTASADASHSWEQDGWPLIKRFCIECHNEDYQEAEIDLSPLQKLDSSDPASSSMLRVLEMVRFGAMPPEDAEVPTDKERKQLVTALDKALYAVTCDLRPRPGKVTARRLNRAEYNNTIRDLFGLDLRPADKFPSDEVGAGFGNNGDVLSLSPIQIEKYLDAAEFVASKVIVDPSTLPKADIEIPSDRIRIHGKSKTGRFNGRFLDAKAFAWVEFDIPVKGEYRVKVRGGTTERDAPKMDTAIYNESGLLIEIDDLKYFGGGGRSQSFDFRCDFAKGNHRLFFEPIEEGDEREFRIGKDVSEQFKNVDPKIIRGGNERAKKNLKPDDKIDFDDYPFMIREVEIDGPTRTPEHLLPPGQKELVAQIGWYDHGAKRWRKVEESAKYNLSRFMRLAFRQPVKDDELKPYINLVKGACERGDGYYRGMQIAISAVLVSPRFLFRAETPPENWKPKDTDGDVPLTPHQLATRMSYFLWSSTPDETLLREADGRRLTDKQLPAVVRRMLADPRSQSLASQFAAQWLGLRNLQEHDADTEVTFPDFDPRLKAAMQQETQALFMQIVRDNRSVAQLLTADYTFVNRELAQHYGLKTNDKDFIGDEFKRVSLKSSKRRGILSHASMLMLTSESTRTSPVKRGKWILENVLGTPPPDPPANVPDLEQAAKSDENASLREQLEIHRESPACASCHRVMDQLGFGLEEFDAIGRYRTEERGKPVDASGVLPGGRKFNGAAELSKVLGATERQAFAKTVTERLLTFALGRELSPNDRCVVDEIVRSTENDDFRFVDIVQAIVQSRPFQYYEAQ